MFLHVRFLQILVVLTRSSIRAIRFRRIRSLSGHRHDQLQHQSQSGGNTSRIPGPSFVKYQLSANVDGIPWFTVNRVLRSFDTLQGRLAGQTRRYVVIRVGQRGAHAEGTTRGVDDRVDDDDLGAE